MPEMETKSLDQILIEQAAVAQAEAASRSLDFSRGSVFRALAEAYGSIGLWLQGLILRLLANTRAATSQGVDLDTWMADYEVARAEPSAARGEVTFSRFTPGLPALIPFGTQVKTADAAWTYIVIDGSADAATDPVQQGYVLPAGQVSITVPVEATLTGAGGNAAPNTVTLLSSAVPFVDTVTNANAMVGGTEAESDETLRATFRTYIGSLPRAVRAAIDYAISRVQAGLSWSILEGQRPDGSVAGATFTVVVDDGTGDPPLDLITRVAAAVEEYRGLGISYAVVGPVLKVANVTMAITTLPDADHATVVGTVQTALVNYINAVPLGSGLSYTRLSQVAYQASPQIDNITSVLLNNGLADIPASPRQAVRAGVIAVS